MTPAQMRAAREMLGWSRDRLAGLSSTSVAFITAYEENGREVRLRNARPLLSPVPEVRATLEAAGIEFIEDNSSGPGVRLRQPVPTP